MQWLVHNSGKNALLYTVKFISRRLKFVFCCVLCQEIIICI